MRSLKRQLKDYKEHVRHLTVQVKRAGGQVPLFPNSFKVMANRDVRKHKSMSLGDIIENNPNISDGDPNHHMLKRGQQVTIEVINEEWFEEFRDDPTYTSVFLPRNAWPVDESNVIIGPDGVGRKNFTQISGAVKSPPAQQPPLLQMGEEQIHEARVQQMREGEWLCDECNGRNYAFRSECNRCRGIRPVGMFLNDATSRSFINRTMNPDYDHQMPNTAMNASISIRKVAFATAAATTATSLQGCGGADEEGGMAWFVALVIIAATGGAKLIYDLTKWINDLRSRYLQMTTLQPPPEPEVRRVREPAAVVPAAGSAAGEETGRAAGATALPRGRVLCTTRCPRSPHGQRCEGSCALEGGHSGPHQECLECTELDVDRLEQLVKFKDCDIRNLCEYAQSLMDVTNYLTYNHLDNELRDLRMAGRGVVQTGSKATKIQRLTEYHTRTANRKNNGEISCPIALNTNVALNENHLGPGGLQVLPPLEEANRSAELREAEWRRQRTAASVTHDREAAYIQPPREDPWKRRDPWTPYTEPEQPEEPWRWMVQNAE